MERTQIDNLGIPPLAGLCTYEEAGRVGYGVEHNVNLLKRYIYVASRLNSIFAAHLARTPEWEVKCAMSLHMWLDAEHSTALRKRVDEMREPPLHLDRVPDEKLAAWLDEAIRAENTTELLTGIYRVIKPELVRALRKHPAETNPLVDYPTCRILKQMLAEEEEMVAWGREQSPRSRGTKLTPGSPRSGRRTCVYSSMRRAASPGTCPLPRRQPFRRRDPTAHPTA